VKAALLVKMQTEQVSHLSGNEIVNMFCTDGSKIGMQPVVSPLAFLILHHPVSFHRQTNPTQQNITGGMDVTQ
jgi:hypothetical protein